MRARRLFCFAAFLRSTRPRREGSAQAPWPAARLSGPFASGKGRAERAAPQSCRLRLREEGACCAPPGQTPRGRTTPRCRGARALMHVCVCVRSGVTRILRGSAGGETRSGATRSAAWTARQALKLGRARDVVKMRRPAARRGARRAGGGGAGGGCEFVRYTAVLQPPPPGSGCSENSFFDRGRYQPHAGQLRRSVC